MRQFDTGATRNDDTNKLDPEGFLNPQCLLVYSQYMHKHRYQDDGSVRASDNWQKGIPKDSAMKSLLRHTLDLWLIHRGYMPGFSDQDALILDVLSAIAFNAFAYMHTVLGESHETTTG